VKATEPIRERQSAVLGFAEGTGVPVLILGITVNWLRVRWHRARAETTRLEEGRATAA
jgi:hypothetical protein